MSLWMRNGAIVGNSSGQPVDCPECPCGPEESGSGGGEPCPCPDLSGAGYTQLLISTITCIPPFENPAPNLAIPLVYDPTDQWHGSAPEPAPGEPYSAIAFIQCAGLYYPDPPYVIQMLVAYYDNLGEDIGPFVLTFDCNGPLTTGVYVLPSSSGTGCSVQVVLS